MRDFLWKYFKIDVYICGSYVVAGVNIRKWKTNIIITTKWLGFGKHQISGSDSRLVVISYNFGFISFTTYKIMEKNNV